MGLYINNQQYGTPWINGVRMKTAYINGRNIWPPYTENDFYIKFVNPATKQPIQGSIIPSWNASGPNLEYKKSHGVWTSFASGTEVTSERDGVILFRGTGRTALYSNYSGSPWSSQQSFIAFGKLGSLLDYENPDNPAFPSCCFFGLFRNSTVIEADITVNRCSGGYNSNSMSCGFMFENSTLQKARIRGMNKTTELNQGAWGNFFYHTPVTSVDIDFTGWGNYSTWPNTINWVQGVPADGTFYKPALLPIQRGVSAIPNWTVIDKE
jgi:hypothetical protein